jgi:hypothetical protein
MANRAMHRASANPALARRARSTVHRSAGVSPAGRAARRRARGSPARRDRSLDIGDNDWSRRRTGKRCRPDRTADRPPGPVRGTARTCDPVLCQAMCRPRTRPCRRKQSGSTRGHRRDRVLPPTRPTFLHPVAAALLRGRRSPRRRRRNLPATVPCCLFSRGDVGSELTWERTTSLATADLIQRRHRSTPMPLVRRSRIVGHNAQRPHQRPRSPNIMPDRRAP